MPESRLEGGAIYDAVACGELQGSTTALQLPDIPCKIAILKAEASNAGKVYLGGAGVTAIDGTTDATTGLQLSAGEMVRLEIANLNLLYRICGNSGDDLTYLVLR